VGGPPVSTGRLLAVAAKLRRQGVEYVALTDGHRLADFSVGEIIRGGIVR
jgi:hypothetical protein